VRELEKSIKEKGEKVKWKRKQAHGRKQEEMSKAK